MPVLRGTRPVLATAAAAVLVAALLGTAAAGTAASPATGTAASTATGTAASTAGDTTPTGADLVGAGSGLDDGVLATLARSWNDRNAATDAPLLASFAASGTATIDLPSGTIARPTDSGAAKALLFGSSDVPDLGFARTASSSLTRTEKGAGLVSLPFATASLGLAGAVHHPDAPASLTDAQLVGVYDGSVTDWSQVGGSPGAVHPYLPAADTDTGEIFRGWLAQVHGSPVTLGSQVRVVTENDLSPLADDPGAVEPAIEDPTLAGTAATYLSTLTGGVILSDVVRGADVDDPAVTSLLGSSGWLCSDATRTALLHAGMRQLARPADGGACGVPVQTGPKNYLLNRHAETVTSVTAAPAPGAGRLAVTAHASRTDNGRPQLGTFTFLDGTTVLATKVATTRHHTATWTGADPGRGPRTVTAVFDPQDSTVDASRATGSAYLRASSAVGVSFTHQILSGTRTTVGVDVTPAGITEAASGSVQIFRGCRLLGTAPLALGHAIFTLPALYRGDNPITVRWAGDAHVLGSAHQIVVHQTGGPSANPLTQCTWHTYRGDQDQTWEPYRGSTGTTRRLLGAIVDQPKATWFGRWVPGDRVYGAIHKYVVASQHGDPDALVQLSIFRADPWEDQVCRHLPTAAQYAAYRRWIDSAARAIGPAYTALILQPDGPFALCAPHHSTLPSREVAYAARVFGALPNTSVYIDAGAADWLRDTPQTAVRLLEADGIRYARGFALNATHYDSTARQVKFGAHVAQALAAAGYTDRHFVVNTAENGRPFKGYTYNRHPTGTDFDNAGVCATRASTRCVTLGIPPTTDVDDPRWHLSPEVDALADRYADGYLWFGRPWLDEQAAPFDLARALQLVRTTPY